MFACSLFNGVGNITLSLAVLWHRSRRHCRSGRYKSQGRRQRKRRLAPHAARGLGRPLRPDRPKHRRPTQPGVLPTAGTASKARNRRDRQLTAAPGHLPPLAWLGDNSRSFPAVAAPVPPRGHQRHVSTLCPPFPPRPPSHLDGVAVQAVGRN